MSPRPCQTRGPRQATNPWPTQPAWSHRGRRTWRMITRVPRELGRPCRLHRNAGRRPGLPTPGGSTAPCPGLSGTNEGRNDGIAKRRKRSAAKETSGSRSASEYRRAGGTIPRDPGEGRRRRLMNRWRETCQVRRDLIPCPRNDNGSRGSRVHEMRNRVRVMCKPGSVGGRGGQPPRSTRPELSSRIRT